jgi:hypothetical protein
MEALMSTRATVGLASLAALVPQATASTLPAQKVASPAPLEVPRAQVSALKLFISLPDGSAYHQDIDPAHVDGIYWSDRAVGVLGSFHAESAPLINHEAVAKAWNEIGASGYLPPCLLTTRSAGLLAMDPKVAPTHRHFGERAKLTGILVTMGYPDGKVVPHTIDPKSDALCWSDDSVNVLASFYAPGRPAEGKVMNREDLLACFPTADVLIGDQQEIRMTPEWIQTIWNHPKQTGTTPAFLVKSMMNPTNG